MLEGKPDYDNQILMYNNSRDTIGISLLRNGHSLNTVISPVYSGDAISMMDENPDRAYVVPEEGEYYNSLWNKLKNA